MPRGNPHKSRYRPTPAAPPAGASTPIIGMHERLSLDWHRAEGLFALRWRDLDGTEKSIRLTPLAAGYLFGQFQRWAGTDLSAAALGVGVFCISPRKGIFQTLPGRD
jgi:hypothetical protein